LVYDEKILSKE